MEREKTMDINKKRKYHYAVDTLSNISLLSWVNDVRDYVYELEDELTGLRQMVRLLEAERDELISMLPRPDLWPRRVNIEEATKIMDKEG